MTEERKETARETEMQQQVVAQISSTLGMQIPYSVENEQALLGAMILDSERIGDVTHLVKSDDFYIDKHGKIFSALVDLFSQGKGIDVVTLLTLLVKDGVYTEESGTAYIRQLAENVPGVTNVMDYALVVKEKSLLRQLIFTSESIIRSAYGHEGDVKEILQNAEQRIFELTQGETAHDFTRISEIIQQFYVELKELTENKEQSSSIQTYFSEIDWTLAGMNPGDFILVGARPGMGKTSFVMNIAAEVAKHRTDKAVAIFSLEMTKTQLAARLLASEGHIDSKKLREGDLEDEDYGKLTAAAVALSETKIYIDDSNNMTVGDMRSKLLRIKDLGLVIIDYLQLMHSNKYRDNRVLEIADITRNLKIVAKELGVPIICCSQLSRIAQDRKDKRPQLTDLRDSGAIEQDADVVMFLHREKYYDLANKEDDNSAECIIAKNRHGGTRTVKMIFDERYTRFLSVEKKYEGAEA
ncbi:MAG: replicative DNA helicase [Clostridia bacterium]|nr:replicative DNA helicase [Clostridia bacterium]